MTTGVLTWLMKSYLELSVEEEHDILAIEPMHEES